MTTMGEDSKEETLPVTFRTQKNPFSSVVCPYTPSPIISYNGGKVHGTKKTSKELQPNGQSVIVSR